MVSVWLGFLSLVYTWTRLVFFFFQAEDGIRDWSVTGVQTCALPISHTPGVRAHAHDGPALARHHAVEHRPRAVDHAPEIELDLLFPLRALLLDEEPVEGPAHVVDEHVHSPPARLDLAHGPLHGIPLRHVGGHPPDRGRSRPPSLGGRLLALARVDFRDGDVGPLAGEGE